MAINSFAIGVMSIVEFGIIIWVIFMANVTYNFDLSYSKIRGLLLFLVLGPPGLMTTMSTLKTWITRITAPTLQ